jgi:hypothetical protein
MLIHVSVGWSYKAEMTIVCHHELFQYHKYADQASCEPAHWSNVGGGSFAPALAAQGKKMFCTRT